MTLPSVRPRFPLHLSRSPVAGDWLLICESANLFPASYLLLIQSFCLPFHLFWLLMTLVCPNLTAPTLLHGFLLRDLRFSSHGWPLPYHYNSQVTFLTERTELARLIFLGQIIVQVSGQPVNRLPLGQGTTTGEVMGCHTCSSETVSSRRTLTKLPLEGAVSVWWHVDERGPGIGWKGSSHRLMRAGSLSHPWRGSSWPHQWLQYRPLLTCAQSLSGTEKPWGFHWLR